MAEFLKSTFDDALSKVLQPAGVVPAALLVLLQLGFILPAAERHDVGVASTYSGLGEATQVIVVAALILVVGFVLLSASAATLDVLSGQTWRASLAAGLGSWWRGQRRQNLRDRIRRARADAGADVEDIDALDWRLRTRYAPADLACAPTALGDALLAYDRSTDDRFGVRLAALAEPMRAVADAEQPAMRAVADEKTAVDLLANLTLVGALFAAEVVIAFSLWDEPGAVVLGAATAALAVVAYRVLVTKSRSWCDAIDTMLLLHLDDLLKEMGGEATGSLVDRRAKLAKLSEFLLDDGPAEGIVGSVVQTGPSVQASTGIAATVSTFCGFEPSDRDTPAAMHRAYAEHLLIVSRTGETSSASGVLTLTEAAHPAIGHVEADPAPEVYRDAAGEQPDTLLWRLDSIRSGSGRTLSVRVDRWRFELSHGLTMTMEGDGADGAFFLNIVNKTGSKVAGATLSAFSADATDDQPLKPLNPVGCPTDAGERTMKWPLPDISDDQELALALRLGMESVDDLDGDSDSDGGGGGGGDADDEGERGDGGAAPVVGTSGGGAG